MKKIIGIAFAFALCAAASADAAESLPNVVIIYADDMGYGDMSANNPESLISTPRLDSLAAGGINFSDMSSSSGICSPSRFSLLTGQYHWRRFHRIVRAWEGSVFKEDDFTLPKMFRQKGYHTAAIGKWHLGWGWQSIVRQGVSPTRAKNGELVYQVGDMDWSKPIPQGPLFAGFDYYFGDDAPNFPPYTWIENDRVLTEPTEPFKITDDIPEGSPEAREGPMAKGWKITDVLPRLQERSVEFIKNQKGKRPFFLYLALTSPHTPIVPSSEFLGKSGAGPYGDFVVQSDAFVGAVIDALKESGMHENTIVIFSSDNGAASYAFARDVKYGHWSNRPFRGVKADIWEGGHRVPFVFSWPAKIKGGGRAAQMLNQADVFATLAEIVGYDLPEDAALDSLSFKKVLEGSEQSPRERMVLNVHETGLYGVRVNDWVYIDHRKKDVPRGWKEPKDYLLKNSFPLKDDDAPAELFNLSDDVGQRSNLYGSHPQKVEELSRILKEELGKKRTRP